MTGVVMDLDAQRVDIRGVGPTAAAVFGVASDLGCHSASGFLGGFYAVAVVLRVEAPGGLFNVGGLKQNQPVRTRMLSPSTKVTVGADLPDAAPGQTLGLICIVLRIAVKALQVLLRQRPPDSVKEPQGQGKVTQEQDLDRTKGRHD